MCFRVALGCLNLNQRIPTDPIYYLAKPQPRERACQSVTSNTRRNHQALQSSSGAQQKVEKILSNDIDVFSSSFCGFEFELSGFPQIPLTTQRYHSQGNGLGIIGCERRACSARLKLDVAKANQGSGLGIITKGKKTLLSLKPVRLREMIQEMLIFSYHHSLRQFTWMASHGNRQSVTSNTRRFHQDLFSFSICSCVSLFELQLCDVWFPVLVLRKHLKEYDIFTGMIFPFASIHNLVHASLFCEARWGVWLAWHICKG